MKIIIEVEKEFLECIKFLENTEYNIKVLEDKIIIESDKVSKLRANINLIMRLLNLYERISNTLSNL